MVVGMSAFAGLAFWTKVRLVDFFTIGNEEGRVKARAPPRWF